MFFLINEINVEKLLRPGSIYRYVMGILLLFIWFLFLIRAQKKKTSLLRKLTIYFGLYFLAVVATSFSKYLLTAFFTEDTYIYWFLYYDQPYKIFIFAANIIYYRFYIEIFGKHKEENKILTYIVYSLGILGLIATFWPINYDLWELITALFLVIQALLIYIPATLRSNRLYKQVDTNSKRIIFVLFLHSLITTFIWIFIVLDVVAFEITGSGHGVPFYILWTLVFLSAITAYIGYTNPKWFSKSN